MTRNTRRADRHFPQAWAVRIFLPSTRLGQFTLLQNSLA